jgi:hypothetical protein
VVKLKYLEMTLTNQNCIYEEIKYNLKSGNVYFHGVQNTQNYKVLYVAFYGCEHWFVTLVEECRLKEFANRVPMRISEPERD